MVNFPKSDHNFAFTLGNGKIDIFTPQVSTHTCAKLYPEVKSFMKNGDKIWLGKILANDIQFTKFVQVFPHHNFVLLWYVKVLW